MKTLRESVDDSINLYAFFAVILSVLLALFIIKLIMYSTTEFTDLAWLFSGALLIMVLVVAIKLLLLQHKAHILNNLAKEFEICELKKQELTENISLVPSFKSVEKAAFNKEEFDNMINKHDVYLSRLNDPFLFILKHQDGKKLIFKVRMGFFANLANNEKKVFLSQKVKFTEALRSKASFIFKKNT